jgi:hypothetical protein
VSELQADWGCFVNPIHEKLRKLLVLAQQGVGGERDNAQALLEALMAKHGVCLSDLLEETRTMQWFKPAQGIYEKHLLHQVIGAVVGKCSMWSDKRKGKSRLVGVEVTKAERLEIDLRYPVYLKAMKAEMKICYSAFVQKNQIFHSDSSPADLSDVDLKELERILMAMRGMEKVEIQRTLTNL